MSHPRRIERWGLRMPLLVATAISIVVALAVVYVVVAKVGGSKELQSQHTEDRAVARVLVAEVNRGLTHRRITSVKQLLADEHMRATIVKGNTVIRVGPVPPAGVQVATVHLALAGGGIVTVSSPVDSLPDPPFAIVLLATGALVLVLGVTLTTYAVLTRATRQRVASAVVAAQRISAGDFRARVGSYGPEPLRSLGRAFDDMALRLQEADATQRALLADLAHEIATPVHALSGYAKAVLDGTIRAPDATAAIDSQTDRLSHLLDELAELRLLDDERPVRAAAVDLRSLIERIVRDLAATAPEVRLEARLVPLTLTSDPDLVETVVRNFVTNALRFTPAGGTVTVSTRPMGRDALISVRDSGPGIAPAHQPRVFDRFYRVESSRDRAQGGTGLGLAIARKAAERLGGRVELASTPGQGADFRLVLPTSLPAGTGTATAGEAASAAAALVTERR